MRIVILCVLLIDMLHNTYSLLDDEKYSKEEIKSPWHPVLNPYGDLMDRAKPLKISTNEDKLFYPSGYGVVGRPYYPIQYVQEYNGYPYYGEMVYQPNGWFTGAITPYNNLVRNDRNNV